MPRRLTIIIVLITVSIPHAWADRVPTYLPYSLCSQGERYFLRSIPYEVSGRQGYTAVYDAATEHLLYQFDTFLKDQVFLSADSKYIVAVSYASNYRGDTIDYAIRFYKNGKRFKNYSVADLVKDSSKLLHSTSHTFWRYAVEHHGELDKEKGKFLPNTQSSFEYMIQKNNVYQSNDTLYVTTVERETFIFYIPTGKLISKKDALQFFEPKGLQFSFVNREKQVMPGWNLMPYPLPAFKDIQTDMTNALANILHYKPGEQYRGTVVVSLKLLIEKETGDFTIQRLNVYKRKMEEPDQNGIINFTSGEQVEEKVRDWLKGKKFETNTIPPWMVRYVYSYEFNFNYQ